MKVEECGEQRRRREGWREFKFVRDERGVRGGCVCVCVRVRMEEGERGMESGRKATKARANSRKDWTRKEAVWWALQGRWGGQAQTLQVGTGGSGQECLARQDVVGRKQEKMGLTAQVLGKRANESVRTACGGGPAEFCH